MKNWIRPGTHVNDAHTSAEKLLSVSLASREDVDAWLAKAVEAGGQAGPYVMDEFGATCGLYSRSFEDLDGHLWEVMCDLLKKDEP